MKTNKKHLKFKSLNAKGKRFKFLKRKFLLKIFAFSLSLFLLLILFTAIVVLRHKQLCLYQGLINSSRVVDQSTELDFCPNLFNLEGIGKAVSNVFRFNIVSTLSVATNDKQSKFDRGFEDCTDTNDPICWLQQLNSELKQTEGFTNILVVGADTRREGEIDGNTDSILLISYEQKSGLSLITSFPRDLIIKHTTPQGWSVENKVNAIFASYGVEGLTTAISQVTGKKIHYYVFINFSAFRQIIDNLGTITIELEKPFRDAFPLFEYEQYGKTCEIPVYYATGDFCIINFPAGTQTFDSGDAMVYSRARYLSSDWDRALRQQKIIEAILKSSLSSSLSFGERIELYRNIFATLGSNVVTNITLEDLGAFLKNYQNFTGNSGNLVLSPELNSYTMIRQVGYQEGYGDGSRFYDETYSVFKDFLVVIAKSFAYFVEQPKVVILNASGKPLEEFSEVTSFLNSPHDFMTLNVYDKSKTNLKGVRIYDFSQGTKAGSLQKVRESIPSALLYSPFLDGIARTDNGEDILILLGEVN